MNIVAVDLAAKLSAACRMDLATGEVVAQFDSWDRPTYEFVSDIAHMWHGLFNDDATANPVVCVVEDLPHRLPRSTLVKNVSRLQGRIEDRLDGYGVRDRILYVPPVEWRHAYDGLATGTGPDAVVQVAAGLGYTPPDLGDRATGRGRKATARKVGTDYCAAYLIARWARHVYLDTGTFDTPNTSRPEGCVAPQENR